MGCSQLKFLYLNREHQWRFEPFDHAPWGYNPYKVTDKALRYIAEGCPQLEVLDVSGEDNGPRWLGWQNITDDGLKVIGIINITCIEQVTLCKVR